MTHFNPIDHKDSDPEYRAVVRRGIETRLGCGLTALESPEALLGDWNRTFPQLPKQASQQFSYFADGTFAAPDDTESSPRGRWTVEHGTYTETTWCAPVPEYGINEGTWNPSTYHAAVTPAGAIVLWNGDGSLLMLLTRPVPDQ